MKNLTKVIIEIETENAAFDDNKIMEVKRILEAMLENHNFNNENDCILQDINGNTVGNFKFIHE